MWIADELDALGAPTEEPERRDFESIDEWDREVETENLHRLAIVCAGRRNGKDLDAAIVAAAVAAGANITSEDFDEQMRRVQEIVTRAVQTIGELMNALVAAINEAWQPSIAALEELWDAFVDGCEYADVDEPEEDDRHDGAIEVLVTWLLPVPSLRQLYGQGVDYGGPGPSRLTLTRVTDDGLRRAETGRNRKGERTMVIFMNVLLGIVAAVLFLGVVGEKDKQKHQDLTFCFIATLATIVLINFVV